MNRNAELHIGDAESTLRDLPAESVQTCITSPPYWGLRDYGEEGQLGLEDTPDEYVQKLVDVFREVRRVLRDNGTLWLNLGDSYFGGGYSNHDINSEEWNESAGDFRQSRQQDLINANPDLKPKSKQYYYDADAIREDASTDVERNGERERNVGGRTDGFTRVSGSFGSEEGTRNRRDVWQVNTKPFPDAHFAVYPPELIEPCVKAGSAEGDLVLDPFAGAGTTGLVALAKNRSFTGVELSQEYTEMAANRIRQDAPLMNDITVKQHRND